MQIENIIAILKENFDCDENGLDWQEQKYIFENNSDNVYDIAVNGITVPFVSDFFLNNEELIISGKHDLVLAVIPREIINELEVIKK